MQVGAINSVNFGNSIDLTKDFYTENYSQDEMSDVDYIDLKKNLDYDKFEKSLTSDEIADAISKFDETASKINSNVHPATILVTLLSAVAFAKGASRVIPTVRRATVAVGEEVAVLGTKAFCKAANVVKKDKFEQEKIVNSIKDFSKKHLMVNNQELSADELQKKVDNSKILDVTQRNAARIFGSEKADSIRNSMIKNKIVNGAGLFDALAALGIGIGVVDKTSDKAEETLDKVDIAHAIDDAMSILGGC